MRRSIRALIRSEVVLTLLAGAVGGAVVAIPAYWGTTREMDVKMVEIAVGILAKEPEPGIAPAREWAVDVISHYAPDVKLSKEVRQALVDYKAVQVGGWITTGYYDVYDFLPPGQPQLRTPAPAN